MWIQFTDSCGICSQIPSRSVVFLGAWIRREMVRNLHWQTRRIMGSNCTENEGKFSQDPVIQYFVLPVPSLKEENCEAKEEVRSQYTSMVEMKASSCFSARWFLRISSVSSEPSQTYATNYPKVLGLRWNLMHLIIWKRWKFLSTFLLQKILPVHSSGELGARIRAKIRTLVRKPETIQSMLWCGFEACRKRTILLYSWYRRRAGDIYTENTKCFETRGRLVQEDGFSRTRESAQSWTLKFVIMKTNTQLKFRSHLCFKTEPLLGLESWMVLISMWQNRC